MTMRKGRQITNLSNERGDVTINFIEIKRIIRNIMKNKLDNLDEMDKFLEK